QLIMYDRARTVLAGLFSREKRPPPAVEILRRRGWRLTRTIRYPPSNVPPSSTCAQPAALILLFVLRSTSTLRTQNHSLACKLSSFPSGPGSSSSVAIRSPASPSGGSFGNAELVIVLGTVILCWPGELSTGTSWSCELSCDAKTPPRPETD